MTDENRDLNGHPEEDIKRQRTQYNGDQLYSNLWTGVGKWSIKDEHKLLSELGGAGATNGGSPYYDSSPGSFTAPTTTSDLYDSITTMSQAQANSHTHSHLYNPPIGTTIVGGVPPLAPISMQEIHKLGSGTVLDPASLSPVQYHTESAGYHPGSEGTGSPGLPLSLQADPAPAPSPPPDPSSLTVLQPPPGAPTAFQPAFSHHYSTGSGSGVPDYTYSSPYSQYSASPYGSYNYSSATGGLLSK